MFGRCQIYTATHTSQHSWFNARSTKEKNGRETKKKAGARDCDGGSVSDVADAHGTSNAVYKEIGLLSRIRHHRHERRPSFVVADIIQTTTLQDKQYYPLFRSHNTTTRSKYVRSTSSGVHKRVLWWPILFIESLPTRKRIDGLLGINVSIDLFLPLSCFLLTEESQRSIRGTERTKKKVSTCIIVYKFVESNMYLTVYKDNTSGDALQIDEIGEIELVLFAYTNQVDIGDGWKLIKVCIGPAGGGGGKGLGGKEGGQVWAFGSNRTIARAAPLRTEYINIVVHIVRYDESVGICAAIFHIKTRRRAGCYSTANPLHSATRIYVYRHSRRERGGTPL